MQKILEKVKRKVLLYASQREVAAMSWLYTLADAPSVTVNSPAWRIAILRSRLWWSVWLRLV